ncbi:MAG: Gmad2 immunoglobulin-like domain-containing protein [Patescibacteria group bacterium]
MKTWKKVLLGLLILAVVWLFIRFVIGGPEDDWICVDGEWVKHGAPATPMPTEGCKDEVTGGVLIYLDSPHPNELVQSPLKVSGRARGNWFFEGDFPIIITNWDGLIIGEGFATAGGEWMTEEFVEFEGEVEFEIPEDIGDFSDRGALILKKDNPSGLPKYDDALEISIKFRE